MSNMDFDSRIENVIRSAMRRREVEVELQDHHDEIERLKNCQAQENIFLREEIGIQYRHD